MMYIVTAVRDIYESDFGVEIAGIFDSEEKALKAKEKVITWFEENEYENYAIVAAPCNVNCLDWYEINEEIKLEDNKYY